MLWSPLWALPVIETTPIGFILWEIWLLVVGISLVRVLQRRLDKVAIAPAI